MGMTMTQKILAAHAGLDRVEPGQLIMAKLDMVLGNDITSPVAINEFEKAGFTSVFDKTKISLVMDHFAPNKDIKAAQQTKQSRNFANKYDILNFYDVGSMGTVSYTHLFGVVGAAVHHRQKNPFNPQFRVDLPLDLVDGSKQLFQTLCRKVCLSLIHI